VLNKFYFICRRIVSDCADVISNQIKSLFESGKSPYTQTHTRIYKTQYTIKEETMKL